MPKLTLTPVAAASVTLSPTDGDTTHVFAGRVASWPTPTGKKLRLLSYETSSPDADTDRIWAFTYNRLNTDSGTLTVEDTTKESYMMSMESWYNGSFEWNIDIRPKNGSADIRPFGFAAEYDGASAGLAVGTAITGAGGVAIYGGTGANARPYLRIHQRATESVSDHIFAILQPGSSSATCVAWKGSAIPRLVFPLDGTTNASAQGPYGIMKFSKTFDLTQPIFGFSDMSAAQPLIGSLIGVSDTQHTFEVQAGGVMKCGPGGSTAPDIQLSRLAANVLGTASGDKLVANGGLGVGNSAVASAVGTLSKKMEVFDAAGASIGFVPIYTTIT